MILPLEQLGRGAREGNEDRGGADRQLDEAAQSHAADAAVRCHVRYWLLEMEIV